MEERQKTEAIKLAQQNLEVCAIFKRPSKKSPILGILRICHKISTIQARLAEERRMRSEIEARLFQEENILNEERKRRQEVGLHAKSKIPQFYFRWLNFFQIE